MGRTCSAISAEHVRPKNSSGFGRSLQITLHKSDKFNDHASGILLVRQVPFPSCMFPSGIAYQSFGQSTENSAVIRNNSLVYCLPHNCPTFPFVIFFGRNPIFLSIKGKFINLFLVKVKSTMLSLFKMTLAFLYCTRTLQREDIC